LPGTAKLVDTHCHLGDARFDSDRSVVVERAVAAGVGHSIIIADSEPATEQAIGLAESLGLTATAGVHPHQASSWSPDVARAMESALENPVVVAVGETGLDYHYDFSPRDAQRAVFAEHLALAARHALPAVVHSRNADEDLIAILRDAEVTLVLHSFCGGPELLAVALERNDYVSFSGMVTFNSWKDVEAVRAVPADRILVETDSPYLAPVPFRGKRNEPSYVTHVAAKVAEIRGVSLEQIEKETTENAIRCFGVGVDPTVRGAVGG
jgi:TatD DNase family protein